MEEIAPATRGEITWLDGVSVDYPDWHFNVRPSNTEPLLRLNLESLISREDMERNPRLAQEFHGDIMRIVQIADQRKRPQSVAEHRSVEPEIVGPLEKDVSHGQIVCFQGLFHQARRGHVHDRTHCRQQECGRANGQEADNEQRSRQHETAGATIKDEQGDQPHQGGYQ